MRVDKLIPEVYYKESRDFAYIGRLLEVVFNYMKTAADCVNVNLENEGVDGTIVDLLVDTLGFELKHEYVNKDLIGIANTFSTLLKYKGTTSAIEMAVRLLLNSQDIKNTADFDFCVLDEEKAEIQVNIPDTLADVVLLEDLFDYILPVGVTYKFTKYSNINNNKQIKITPKSIMETDLNKDNKGTANSAYAYDYNIGIVKSDSIFTADVDDVTQAKNINHPGGFYVGVVATDIGHTEPSAEDEIEEEQAEEQGE